MDPKLKSVDQTQDGLKRSPEKSDVKVSSNIKDDVIGGRTAGGIAGTGGVSTNDVGLGKTTKNPLTER